MKKGDILRIGVLASGRGSNLQAIINRIIHGKLKNVNLEVVIVDRFPCKAYDRALKYSIPAVFVNRKSFGTKQQFEKRMVNVLRGYDVELVVLAGFMRILSGYFVNEFPDRIINIHPALLPEFGGKGIE